jgi:hypothetical protein
MLPVFALLVSLAGAAQAAAPQVAGTQAPAPPPTSAAAPAGAPASDDAGVRAALTHYLQGHATGDPSHFRKAFLPTAHIEGLRDGKFISMTLDEYCSRSPGKPAADEATRRRTIDTIDISGTAAMARVTLIHGPTTLRDYFVLLKVDGEWKIANKSFSAVRAQ